MGARASPTAASQVTLFQAMDIFDEDVVIPETEMIDDVNPSVMVDEAAQLPPLYPILPPSGLADIEHRIAPVLGPVDLTQDPDQTSDLITGILSRTVSELSQLIVQISDTLRF